MADQQQQQQQQQLQQQQQQQQQPQPQQPQQRATSAALSVPVSVQQSPQPIMATASTPRVAATPMPQLQVLPNPMHNPTYLPQFPYNQQHHLMLQAAVQMSQLNMIQQGRAQNANNSGGLLSPTSTQLSVAQAAQLAAAANANSNLGAVSMAAVSMAVPGGNNSNKVAGNGNKPQAVGQGQQQGQAQGQGSQGQGQTAAAPPALVAGKPAMLPQQSGAPLMLGQIANVFSQAGNVAPTFVTQSKGQSIAMPIQAPPQLVNSQAPIRLTQPQLVTNTGQIISSQTMLTNPALLQAVAAAGLHNVLIPGLTNTGQLVQQTMLDNSTALQGGANPQGMQLAPQPLLTNQGQSQAFLASPSLYLRPLQPAQQIPGYANMQGFTALKGKVQIEPNMQQQPQQQQQQQQQPLKAVAIGVASKPGQTSGSTLGKTILPSTSRATVTAKIQPNMAAAQANQGPRLNIPTVIPKQKPRARVTKSATLSATSAATTTTVTSAVTSTAPVPVTIPLVLSSGAGAIPKVIAAANVSNGASAVSSLSKPGTPVTVTPVVVSAPATPTLKSQSDSEVETSKKATPTPMESNATPTPTPITPITPALQPVPSVTPVVTSIKTDTTQPPSSTPTPTPQLITSPVRSEIAASPELKIIIDPKEEESREDIKDEIKEEEEEDMETETEKPVMAVEALPPATLTPVPNSGILTPVPFPLPPLMEKQRAIVKPQILTHVIDGFVIQEGPEPFPVQRSSLLAEFVPPKPTPVPEKDSEDEMTENDDQPPPLLNKSEAHFSGTSEDMRMCEYCCKHRAMSLFRNSGRFCSTACSKRYSVAFSKRVSKFKGGSTSGSYVPKKKHVMGVKKGWRTGHGGRLAFNINMRPAAETPNGSDNQQATSPSSAVPPPLAGADCKALMNTVCSDDKRSVQQPAATELSSSNSGQETSSSAASPPPQQDFDVEMEGPKTDPAKWSVVEVYEFVKNLPGCQEYADEFRQQEIDGQALLLLKEDHLMTAMNIKLGPALKICARINALREEALNNAAAATSAV